jgi:hypothetical protein
VVNGNIPPTRSLPLATSPTRGEVNHRALLVPPPSPLMGEGWGGGDRKPGRIV